MSSTPTGKYATPRVNCNTKKSMAPFKSPFRSQNASNGDGTAKMKNLQEDAVCLKEKVSSLDKEIENLQKEGLNIEELDLHIRKLHEYNEIKDLGQMLLGKIANEQGVTTKDLYHRFQLELDD